MGHQIRLQTGQVPHNLQYLNAIGLAGLQMQQSIQASAPPVQKSVGSVRPPITPKREPSVLDLPPSTSFNSGALEGLDRMRLLNNRRDRAEISNERK